MKAEPKVLSGETVQVDLKKADYTVDYEYGPNPIMHFMGRTKGGSWVHLTNEEARPYFYVPYDEFDDDLETHDYVTGTERGFENIQGEEVVKIFTRIPGDVPKIRDEYTHHEGDILYPNRVMIDEGIEDGVEIPIEYATPEPTEVSFDEMRPVNCDAETRICFCDIEVYNKHGFPNEDEGDMPMTTIAVYDSYLDEYRVYMYHPDLPEVHHEKAEVYVYGQEHEMLLDFCDYLKNRHFGIIAGWNFDDFDSKYLINRLDTLNDELGDDVDIGKNSISPLNSAYDDGWFGGKIKGIAVFDMLKAYENLQFTEMDSYALGSVGQEILGEDKVQHDRDLWELWEDDPQKLVDYNVIDVELTVKLEQQEEIIKFNEAMSTFVGGRVAEVIDPSNAVDIRVLRAVNGDYAVPSANEVAGQSDEFEGGAVFDPITGVRDNVIVLDLKSLYPMSMKTINAGPRTKDSNGEITAPNGVNFTKDGKSIVVDIIDELLEEREELKELRDSFKEGSKQYKKYDRQQSAVKVTMNTLYGVLGWNRFRLYDKDVGASVTATGRECIRFTEKKVENMGYSVIYGDTDSVMIELGSGTTKQQAKEIGFELEEVINDAYDKFASEVLNVDEHWFEIEFEKLYRKYFQAGKKKRYAGHITWKESKDVDDTDIVGFETQRSDYSTVAKELLENVFDIILSGGTLEDISDEVNSTIDSLKSGEIDPDNYGIPSSVTKNFDDYDSPTLAVRGAQYSNGAFDAGIQPGDKPKGMYVDRLLAHDEIDEQPPAIQNGSMYVCWMEFNDVPNCYVWDWETYIDKQMKSPLERILTGTDWTWQEVRSGEKQPGLDDYEFEKNQGEPAEFSEFEGDTDDIGETKKIDTDMTDEDLAKQLSQAQKALDGFEQQEVEDDVMEATMTEPESGDADLDLFLN